MNGCLFVCLFSPFYCSHYISLSPKIVNLGSAKVDMYFERKKFGNAPKTGGGGSGTF